MSLFEKYKQFKAMETQNQQDTKERILLVDGLNSYLRTFAATPTMNDDGKHVGGITGFLLSIGYVVRTFKPSRVVIVFDGAGGSQRRRKIYPEYKGKRRNMTKLNRTYDFASLEDEKEAQKWQLEVLAALLRCLPITLLHIDLVEADDVIAYLATLIASRDQRAIIMSSDKDFLQLVGDNIHIWSPVKKKMYTSERVVEDYLFHPNNFLLYRMVTGDNSDCIGGVEGIKEKTLLKYFPELAQDEKRDISYLLEMASKQVEGVKKPAKALTTLLNSKELLERNHALMRLDEVAMGGINKMDVLSKFDREPNEYDKKEFIKILTLGGMMSNFPTIDIWLQTTFVPLMRYKLDRENK